MNVYTKEYKNHMRDEQQWKMDNNKIYNLGTIRGSRKN
jgi:hypothetical protein